MKIRVAIAIVAIGLVLGMSGALQAQFGRARDPGPRTKDVPQEPVPLPGLSDAEQAMFEAGLDEFSEEETVPEGIGPRFNFVSCKGCHTQPVVGGSSPPVNPLFRIPREDDLQFTRNRIPSFITPDGPVREARFKLKSDGTRDGGVHALFVITGHPDAAGCGIAQEDFELQVRNRNIIFRIPTPVFGAGLIEQIPDSAIVANVQAQSSQKSALGIRGRANRINVSGTANRNGNDGTIARFGWKAQNKSLTLFSGEAYNVEMGITNELFQSERDETTNCQFASVPNDVVPAVDQISAVAHFANFQRFLAPLAPSRETPGGALSIARGRARFMEVGCALCHTPSLQTSKRSTVEALSDKQANLFSDLALHYMGAGLADDVFQGEADGAEFRTAPLWGLGPRVFFLHDGRTKDLAEAIQAHRSFPTSKYGPSEANGVIDRYNSLPRESDRQDILNFLRSL
ncbi:MAG TPA: di-heme oxidoredictase family protein [Methylomirabilota bacterium]